MKKKSGAGAGTLIEKAELLKKIEQLEKKLRRNSALQEEAVKEQVEKSCRAREDLIVLEGLMSLGKLAGSISHEIRNPLNVISTLAYYIKMKAGENNEPVKERIGLIEAEVKKVLNIIDTILNLSGMREPRREQVNIVPIVNDAVSDSSIPDTVKVVKDIPPGDIFVNADEGQLNIVLTNIIKNAIDAMKNSGTLIIKIKKTRDLKLEISFTDTGPGIAYEDLDKVFHPLFSSKERGFGFGLMICKMIVEKHDGKIKINSRPGKGTVVTLTL